ncbi:MAG: hypothetical protein KJ833_09550, partial [Alphaproteobacteria bacterium]|nr:hypothetical protein [Alphaproteobacteria bacterium]
MYRNGFIDKQYFVVLIGQAPRDKGWKNHDGTRSARLDSTKARKSASSALYARLNQLLRALNPVGVRDDD